MHTINTAELISGAPTTFEWNDDSAVHLMPNGERKWILHIGRSPLAVVRGDGPYELSPLDRDRPVTSGERWQALVAKFLLRY